MTAAGIEDMDDPKILTSSLGIAKANTEAREALEVIRAIDAALATLFAMVGVSLATPISRIVQTTDTGDTAAEEIRRYGSGRKLHPWTALTAGYSISSSEAGVPNTTRLARKPHHREVGTMSDDTEQAREYAAQLFGPRDPVEEPGTDAPDLSAGNVAPQEGNSPSRENMPDQSTSLFLDQMFREG